jgi:hypothetical protein
MLKRIAYALDAERCVLCVQCQLDFLSLKNLPYK